VQAIATDEELTDGAWGNLVYRPLRVRVEEPRPGESAADFRNRMLGLETASGFYLAYPPRYRTVVTVVGFVGESK
jgi:hypothetical protein